MTNYPIGDFLIRVKNIALKKGKEVVVRNSKEIEEIAKALKRAGFVSEIKKAKDILNVELVFVKKEPRLMGLTLVSKPGLRIYAGVNEIKQKKGPSIFILTTPKGILSSKEAKKEGVGGEIIAKVW